MSIIIVLMAHVCAPGHLLLFTISMAALGTLAVWTLLVFIPAMIFIRDLLQDLDVLLAGASVLFSDSRSAVLMSLDPVAFKKTKHILRAAHFLRDLVAREVVTLAHVPGTVMLADLLTKAVARAVYVALLRVLDSYAVTGDPVPAM